MKLDKEPVFILTEKERRDFYSENLPKNSYDDKRLLFKPSSIAVNPIDGNYYLLAICWEINVSRITERKTA